MQNPPFGDDMMKHMNSECGILLSRDFLQYILRQLDEAVYENKDWREPLASFQLSALMNLLQAILCTIKCCRLVPNDILTKEDMYAIETMRELMKVLQPLNGAESKDVADLSVSQNISLIICQLKKELEKTILVQLDSESPVEKLKSVQGKLNSN